LRSPRLWRGGSARYHVAVDDPKNNAEKKRQEQRLRNALRENLKRRKAQAKGRAAEEAHGHVSHDSAGIADHKDED
jgi:hypothetical protein